LALLLLGAILARGRQTVTSWVRAARLSREFRPCDTAVQDVHGDVAAGAWDDVPRRPSHTDKRRAWRRELLGDDIRDVGRAVNWLSCLLVTLGTKLGSAITDLLGSVSPRIFAGWVTELLPKVGQGWIDLSFAAADRFNPWDGHRG
jgi:hypothetical protein